VGFRNYSFDESGCFVMEDYLLAAVRQFSAWHRGAEGHPDVGHLRQSAPGDSPQTAELFEDVISVSRIYPGIPEYITAKGRGAYPYLTGSVSRLLLTLFTESFGVKVKLGCVPNPM
jgi:hypothetical protein